MRSLIAELGDAYCEELRRLAIGEFSVDDADPERVVGLEQALSFMPEVRLGADEARRAAHGGAVAGAGTGFVRLVDADGLIGVAEAEGAGMLRPRVVLRS